jgi:hypothetical protein
MAKGLSLTEISRRTRIGVGYLRHIEDGNLKGLPPGFYARAFVRAYAEAIGMDADVVLGTLADDLPAAQAATAPHPGSSHPMAQAITGAAELIPDSRMQVLKQLLDRHNEGVPMELAAQRRSSRVPTGGPRRLMAAMFDGLLLASLYLTVLGITALACRVSIGELVRAEGGAVFTVLALITMLYVVLMGGIAGCTIGAMILDIPLVDRATQPLDVAAIARRSLQFMRADVAAAAEVVGLVETLIKSRRAA